MSKRKILIIAILGLWFIQVLFSLSTYDPGLETQLFLSLIPGLDILFETLMLIYTYGNQPNIFAFGFLVMLVKDALIATLIKDVLKGV